MKKSILIAIAALTAVVAVSGCQAENQTQLIPQAVIDNWEKELCSFWLHPYYHQATGIKFDSVSYGTTFQNPFGFNIKTSTAATGHVRVGATIYPVQIHITLSGTDFVRNGSQILVSTGTGSRSITATRYYCQDEFGAWWWVEKLPNGV